MAALGGGVGAPFAPTVVPATSGPPVLGVLGGSFLWAWDSGREGEYKLHQQHPDKPLSITIVFNEFSRQLHLEGFDYGK